MNRIEKFAEIIKKIKEWMERFPNESIGVIITPQEQYAVIAGIKSSIIEYGCVIKTPDNVVDIMQIDSLILASHKRYEKGDVKIRCFINNREYNHSRKIPYKSNFTYWFYFKTTHFVLMMVMANPLTCIAPSLSGVYISLGIPGVNYNAVIEEISATLNLIATPEFKEKLKKENEKAKELALAENDSINDYYYGSGNFDFDECDEEYESNNSEIDEDEHNDWGNY